MPVTARWQCRNTFPLAATDIRMDACSAEQCVLLGNMLSHHLFPLHLLCLSSYLPPFHPSADVLSVCMCVYERSPRVKHWLKERWWKPGRIAQHSFKPEPRWQTQMTTTADDETGSLMCSCCCVGASEIDSRQGQKCCFELNMQTGTFVQFLSVSPLTYLSLLSACTPRDSVISKKPATTTPHLLNLPVDTPVCHFTSLQLPSVFAF